MSGCTNKPIQNWDLVVEGWNSEVYIKAEKCFEYLQKNQNNMEKKGFHQLAL